MAAMFEQFTLTTPHGHEVRAEVDYEHFEVKSAKVIHTHTGVMRAVDRAALDALERALKAKQVYEHALSETEAVEHTLKKFGKVAHALGNAHPALEPYWKEAAQHRQIADDMRSHAKHYYDAAIIEIEKLAEK